MRKHICFVLFLFGFGEVDLITYFLHLDRQIGLSFTYRKTLKIASCAVKIETKEFKNEIKTNFPQSRTVQDYLDNGLNVSGVM